MKIQDLKVGDRVRYEFWNIICMGTIHQLVKDGFEIKNDKGPLDGIVLFKSVISKFEPRTVWIPKKVTKYKEIPIEKPQPYKATVTCGCKQQWNDEWIYCPKHKPMVIQGPVTITFSPDHKEPRKSFKFDIVNVKSFEIDLNANKYRDFSPRYGELTFTFEKVEGCLPTNIKSGKTYTVEIKEKK